MSIISITTLLNLNQTLNDELFLPFKIHLRDACGKQSFWIEVMEESISGSQYDSLYAALEQFFQKERITLQYSADKMSFWSIN
jgi:hypothetical protein